jgi:K+-transporting ATPase ATPase B chain
MPAARSRWSCWSRCSSALIPTTIGALLSAIGIAGMDRLVRFNVLAMSGRAVEAAGDVDTLLLDKTGTITLGNRRRRVRPGAGRHRAELAEAAQLASLADETPEGRSIVVLAKEKYGIRGRDMAELNATFVPFTAQTRMSGVDLPAAARRIRKGAVDAIVGLGGVGNTVRRRAPDGERAIVDADRQGRRHAAGGRRGRPVLGVIYLKDIVKGGIRERFASCARWASAP